MTIRFAILGCGVIAPTHAAALRLDRRVELRWAADPDLSKAAKLGAAKVTADWREALADPQVDAVCVCTPHQLHREMVLAALAAGKHVVCEKPLATTPEDVASLVAAVPAGKVASGIFQHRFAPLNRRLRQLVADGDFGRIRRVAGTMRCHRSEAYYASGPWRGRWAGEGGGLLINQAIHALDLAIWLSASVLGPLSATVERRRVTTIEVEDAVRLRATTRDSAEFAFDAVNGVEECWEPRITVTGATGSFRVDDNGKLLSIEHPNDSLTAELIALGSSAIDQVKMPGKACYGDHHSLQLADVIAAIAGGRAPFLTFAEAAPANLAVLAAYHSTAIGAPVAPGAAGFRRPELALRSSSSPATT